MGFFCSQNGFKVCGFMNDTKARPEDDFFFWNMFLYVTTKVFVRKEDDLVIGNTSNDIYGIGRGTTDVDFCFYLCA